MTRERIVAIFTGSRALPDEVYFEHCEDLIVMQSGPEIEMAFVGDCPTGLDVWVRQDCTTFGIPLQVFRANWYPGNDGKLDRSAGPRRNQAMVLSARAKADELGLPLVCFAFPHGKSAGTRDCMRRAEKAGAEMRVYEAQGSLKL